MQIAAVVVSHNRRALLESCLTALMTQTRALQGIIVVDNVSTDGSPQMVRARFPKAHLVSLTSNKGGAGGFARGVHEAINAGFDYAWLMDDDAEPTPDALSQLVKAVEQCGAHGRQPGFVASKVVDHEGAVLESHRPPRIGETENKGIMVPPICWPAPFATFVGVLINLDHARGTFLPVGDFFIRWDDIEYTSRIQHLGGGLVCDASVVKHPHSSLKRESGKYLVLDVRNMMWVLTRPRLGSPITRQKARVSLGHRIWDRAPELSLALRLHRIRDVAYGALLGVITRPQLSKPFSNL